MGNSKKGKIALQEVQNTSEGRLVDADYDNVLPNTVHDADASYAEGEVCSNEPPSLYILTLTAFAAIGGFLFGYDTGVISGALVEISDYFPDVTDIWKEAIVSCTVGAAILGAMAGGPSNKFFGRRMVIIASSIIFIAGAIIMGVATSLTALLVGRVVVGIAIGLVSMTIPVYLAETAPDRLRGRLVVVNSLFLTGGQMIANIICGLLQYERDGWRYMLGLSGVPALIQLIGFIWLPESPRWLLSKDRVDEAEAVLKRLRGTDNVDYEFNMIQENIQFEKENTGSLADLFAPGVRRALFIACMLQAIQQLAGINTVMYYAATIFQMAGLNNNLSIWLSAVTAGMNFICTFISFWLIDKAGRKPLLLWSAAGVVICLNVLAVSFYLGQTHSDNIVVSPYVNNTYCDSFSNAYDCTQTSSSHKCGFCSSNNYCLAGDDDGPQYPWTCSSSNWNSKFSPNPYWWLSLISLILYICFFAPGLGTMPWCVQSEIFPLKVRGYGNSFATVTNWSFNLLVSFTFLELTTALTPAGAFWLYAGIVFLSFLFILFFVPETKGKTIELISQMFGDTRNK